MSLLMLQCIHTPTSFHMAFLLYFPLQFIVLLLCGPSCPRPKDFEPLEGRSEADLWIYNASENDEGIYTCTCIWTHNHKKYNSSGSRRLRLEGERAFSGFYKPFLGVQWESKRLKQINLLVNFPVDLWHEDKEHEFQVDGLCY